MTYPSNSESVAQDQIKAFVQRIMRMREEAKAINADIREIYAEAKANGFDKTVLGKLVSYVEKRSTDAAAMAEADAVFDLYLAAYDGTPSRTHAHAREDNQSTGASQRRAQTATGVGTGGDHLGPASRSSAPAKTEVPVHQSQASGDGQSQHNSGVRVTPVDTISGEIPPIETPHGDGDIADAASGDGPCMGADIAADEAEPIQVEASSVTINPDCAKPDTCQFASKSYLCSGCNSARAERLVAQRRGEAMTGIPSWARKGAKVVCVDGAHRGGFRAGLPQEGGVYVIRGVEPSAYHPRFGHYVGLFVVGIVRSCPLLLRDIPLDINRFRPLVARTQEQDISEHFSGFLHETRRAPERVG